MKVVSTVSSMHEAVRAAQLQHRRVALVPTMGALHEGHLSLVRQARRMADVVVVSIFVNPTQFGPNEDFTKYPRIFDDDIRLLSAEGVDFVFAPSTEEMYTAGCRTSVEVAEWGSRLCGTSRPGHFRGVATVVAKLFNIVQPDIALFGKKDTQQAILIQRMVKDLNFPVQIEVCPIIREPDGLALSSRNCYLDPKQRRAALVLSKSLARAKAVIATDECRATRIQEEMRRVFADEPLARLDYIEMVDPETLNGVERVQPGTLIAVAAFVGSTRLIDNWSVELN